LNPGFSQLLRPLSPLYAGLLRLRGAAYRSGLRKRFRLPLPVISVGNITHGGTGKTPVVEALVRDLIRRGRKPAVLTRGYGRKDVRPVVLVGPETGISVEGSGDEPAELASRLPGVPIIVDADRYRGGLRALGLGADCLVLDDGFQHLRLRRDLDILLIDAGDPFGGGKLPPAGRLREPLEGLRRADLCLVTKISGPEIPPLIVSRLEELHPGCPVHGCRMEAARLLGPGGVEELSSLAGRPVLAIAGLGRPEAFSSMLRDLGARIMEERFFPDHHLYSSGEIRELEILSREKGWLPVTTAKDAVKIPAMKELRILEIRMTPLEGEWSFVWQSLPDLAS